jgi:hypothetical protein
MMGILYRWLPVPAGCRTHPRATIDVDTCRSAGKKVEFDGEEHTIEELTEDRYTRQ